MSLGLEREDLSSPADRTAHGQRMEPNIRSDIHTDRPSQVHGVNQPQKLGFIVALYIKQGADYMIPEIHSDASVTYCHFDFGTNVPKNGRPDAPFPGSLPASEAHGA